MEIPQWIRDLPPVAVALVSAAIAMFSLLISATSLFVHWRNYRRDSHNVEVNLQWNAELIHEHGMRSAAKQRFGHMIVTNKGRRPVHITYIGLQLPGRRNSSANWLEQSVKLGEADASITVRIPQDSVGTFRGGVEKDTRHGRNQYRPLVQIKTRGRATHARSWV